MADEFYRLYPEIRNPNQTILPKGVGAIHSGHHPLHGPLATVHDGESIGLILTNPPSYGIDAPGRPSRPFIQGGGMIAHLATLASIGLSAICCHSLHRNVKAESRIRHAMAQLRIIIGINYEPPVAADNYVYKNKRITVSYPEAVDGGLPNPIILPVSSSSVFDIEWEVRKDFDAINVMRATFTENQKLYEALDAINRIIEAFAFVRVGHTAASNIRTIGISDTLFYTAFKDGVRAGTANVRSKYGLAGLREIDPHGTTPLAKPFIGSADFLVARRLLRCFELVEHGYYNEAIIISHSILDDTVQEVLKALLKKKEITDEGDQKLFLRSIKENRMKIYLGPVIKVLHGRDIEELWEGASAAIKWLNYTRNEITHAGGLGDVQSAWKALYVTTHSIAALNFDGLIDANVPDNMMRQARIMASWTASPPAWIPLQTEADKIPFIKR